MAELVGTAAQRERQPTWLKALYALAVLSAVALVTLIVGEIYYAFESGDSHVEHDHGVFGPIFDVAWFVFLPTTFATFVAAVATLIAGRFRRGASLTRYGARAMAYVALAVGVLVVVALLES